VIGYSRVRAPNHVLMSQIFGRLSFRNLQAGKTARVVCLSTYQGSYLAWQDPPKVSMESADHLNHQMAMQIINRSGCVVIRYHLSVYGDYPER